MTTNLWTLPLHRTRLWKEGQCQNIPIRNRYSPFGSIWRRRRIRGQFEIRTIKKAFDLIPPTTPCFFTFNEVNEQRCFSHMQQSGILARYIFFCSTKYLEKCDHLRQRRKNTWNYLSRFSVRYGGPVTRFISFSPHFQRSDLLTNTTNTLQHQMLIPKFGIHYLTPANRIESMP